MTVEVRGALTFGGGLGSKWEGRGQELPGLALFSPNGGDRAEHQSLRGTRVSCVFLPMCHNHSNKDIKATMTAQILMPGPHPGPRKQRRVGGGVSVISNTREAEAA